MAARAPGSIGERFSSENLKPFKHFERWLLWLFGGPSVEFQKRGLPNAFFFGCHMRPHSISVTIFTLLFAYTVP